jgi:hypothetical protein
MSNDSKRIWNNKELTIAYYIAKWDSNGLKMSKEDLAEFVITNTSIRSLDMQAANFRFLLGLEGYQLEDASVAQKNLVDELDNLTVTQVRNIIFTYADSVSDRTEELKRKSANKSVNQKRDELNAELDKNFQARVNSISQFRNLRKL